MLEDLFTKYGTDKGIWGYTPAYEKHLSPRRNEIKNVLEIGICGYRDIPNNVVGASLFAWRDYFPNAEIFGIDNDPRFVFNDQARIHTRESNAYHRVQLIDAIASMAPFGRFDFICDDAVHDPLPQMLLVDILWPLLNAGGVYAIEETCPYKVPNEDVFEHIVTPLMKAHDDMIAIEEFVTHKAERLLILRKA